MISGVARASLALRMEPVVETPVRAPVPPIVVADNDPNVNELLCAILARSGIASTPVFDGNAALAAARRSGVRVVVCDLDMPGASGLDVIGSLAALPEAPSVVVISGYVDADVASKLAAWPFVRGVLKKPFDLLRFATVVSELLAATGGSPEKGQCRS